MKILLVLCLLLVGCASAPKTPMPEPIKLERYEYKDIQPVSTPKPFMYPVEAYKDESGIEWVKVRSEDANIRSRYTVGKIEEPWNGGIQVHWICEMPS